MKNHLELDFFGKSTEDKLLQTLAGQGFMTTLPSKQHHIMNLYKPIFDKGKT